MAKGENRKLLRAKGKARKDEKLRKSTEQERINRDNSITEVQFRAGEPPITRTYQAPSSKAFRLC